MCGRGVDLGMLLALLVAVCKGDASVRLSAAHAILDWRADSSGVTRSAATQYARLLRVSCLSPGTGLFRQPLPVCSGYCHLGGVRESACVALLPCHLAFAACCNTLDICLNTFPCMLMPSIVLARSCSQLAETDSSM